MVVAVDFLSFAIAVVTHIALGAKIAVVTGGAVRYAFVYTAPCRIAAVGRAHIVVVADPGCLGAFSCCLIASADSAGVAVRAALGPAYAEAVITRISRRAEIAVATGCPIVNGFSYAVHFIEELYTFIIRGTGISVVTECTCRMPGTVGNNTSASISGLIAGRPRSTWIPAVIAYAAAVAGVGAVAEEIVIAGRAGRCKDVRRTGRARPGAIFRRVADAC